MFSSEELAPDFAGPLEGWRAWRVIERHGELALASVVRRTVWPAREALTAECLRFDPLRVFRRASRRAVPELDCECGIYAGDLRRASTYLRESLPEARARVLGRVALWGKVVECDHGYRASHAYPVAIYVAMETDDEQRLDGDEIAAGLGRYGVPVELVFGTRGQLPALVARYAR